MIGDKNIMRKNIIVNGKEFKSITEACKYYNLNYKTVSSRLRKGWSIEEAFGLSEGKHVKGRCTEITVEGKTFKSISEACRYYNLEFNLVNNRLYKGWSIEEAFGLKYRNDNYKEITVEGKTFKSIAEAAKYYNLRLDLVHNRLRRGSTIKDAFTKDSNPAIEYKYLNLTIFGKTFKYIVEAAEYYNINYGVIYRRLENGWSIEDGVSIPVKEGVVGKTITVGNNEFVSISEAARYYNLDNGKIYYRLKNGWTIDEAFELVKKEKATIKPIIVEGVSYKSITEACKHYNLDPKRIIYRLNNGWSVEEAFGFVEKEKIVEPITITVEGRTYNSIAEACKHYNLRSGKVYGRINRGWSIEEAFELVKRDNNRNNKEIIVNGIVFKSLAEACKHYNLNYSTIKNRLHVGWSIEEGFELVQRKKR